MVFRGTVILPGYKWKVRQTPRQLFLHHKSHNKDLLDKQVRLTSIREPGWDSGSVKVGLIESAARLLGIEITVKEVPMMGGHDCDEPIHAMLMRYEGEQGKKAKIYVSENENFCYRRFYIAKELCHLLMDDGKQDRYIHTSVDIKKLISDLSRQDGLSTEDEYPAYTSELLAYWGAVELLLPCEFKDGIIGMLGEGDSNSLYRAALECRVPKSVVWSRYMDEGFMCMFDEAYKEEQYINIKLKPVRLGPNRRE